MLFYGLPAQRAAKLLDAVREQLESSSVETPNGPLSFTFSSGVAELPTDSLEALMKNADIQLYEAKEQGRNRVLFEG